MQTEAFYLYLNDPGNPKPMIIIIHVMKSQSITLFPVLSAPVSLWS